MRLAELAVDAADGALDELPLLGVLGHVGARRHRDLHQAHLAAPLREQLEEPPERVEPLRDALGVVEPVDAEHEPARARSTCSSAATSSAVSASGGSWNPSGTMPIGKRADADASLADDDRRRRRPRRRPSVVDALPEVVGVAAASGSRAGRTASIPSSSSSAHGIIENRSTPGTGCGGRGRSVRDGRGGAAPPRRAAAW